MKVSNGAYSAPRIFSAVEIDFGMDILNSSNLGPEKKVIHEDAGETEGWGSTDWNEVE